MSTSLLFQRLLQGESHVPEQSHNPFTAAYFAFLDYFDQIRQIEPQHVIIGANFTYGWMPTMLRLQHTDFALAANVLNHVKARAPITDADVQVLINLINNSIVGVSKLLHFVNPIDYAIWDSRVAAFCAPGISDYRFQRTATYRTYLDQCDSVSRLTAFPALHMAVEQKVGRSITAFRAIELIMYANANRNETSPEVSHQGI
jgi:hypothetical protein